MPEPEPTPDKPPKERKPRKPRRAKQPPPEADAPPKPKAKSGAAKRGERRGRELRTIEAGLTELLSFPAMPAAAFGDEWAVDHFTQRGPALAARITAECERNDQLRRMVLRLVEGQGYMMLAIELGMYAAPPLMHYGLLPGAERLGVPVLTRQPPPQPQGRPAPPQRPQEPPPGAAEGNGGPPTPPEWEAAQEAAQMDGTIEADDGLGYATGMRPGEVPPPAAPPPIEFA